MDRLLHPDRTLEELDPPAWAHPGSDATRLVRRVHGLRRVPLGELGPADLRTLISQQVAPSYVLPLAARLLLPPGAATTRPLDTSHALSSV